MAFRPEVFAKSADLGRDTGLAEFATIDPSTTFDAALRAYPGGSIFSWDLTLVPKKRESPTGLGTIAMYAGRSDRLNDAVFRPVLLDSHYDSETFWIRGRRETQQLKSNNSNVAAGFTGSVAGDRFPSHEWDWMIILEFATALAGLSLGAGLLLRFRKPDPVRIYPALSLIGKQGR